MRESNRGYIDKYGVVVVMVMGGGGIGGRGDRGRV